MNDIHQIANSVPSIILTYFVYYNVEHIMQKLLKYLAHNVLYSLQYLEHCNYQSADINVK